MCATCASWLMRHCCCNCMNRPESACLDCATSWAIAAGNCVTATAPRKTLIDTAAMPQIIIRHILQSYKPHQACQKSAVGHAKLRVFFYSAHYPFCFFFLLFFFLLWLFLFLFFF